MPTRYPPAATHARRPPAFWERTARALELRAQKGETLAAIAKAIGHADNPTQTITRERARQIIARGMEILQHPARRKALAHYQRTGRVDWTLVGDE